MNEKPFWTIREGPDDQTHEENLHRHFDLPLVGGTGTAPPR